MENELYQAAVNGNIGSLVNLLGRDALLLDRFMAGDHAETPLHVAAMLGHLGFVEEMLTRKAELAKIQDSQGYTPLHLAAAKGYREIVEALLQASPRACYLRDKYQRNPLHVAATKGHVGVLQVLAQARPDAARRTSANDRTILHLCVKHNRFEALKFLTGLLGNGHFLNLGDADGNTCLHLAAVDRQTEMINFLTNEGVDPNITNSKGLTALTLLTQGESMERVSGSSSVGEIREGEREGHEALMVVAVLLATMAFQVGMAPPGGLWQDDFDGGQNHPAHIAGEAIIAQKYPNQYRLLMLCNTVSFFTSLTVILFVISDFPVRQKWIMKTARGTMWVAIFLAASLYAIPMILFTPEDKGPTFKTAAALALGWFAVVALLILYPVLYWIYKLMVRVYNFFFGA